MGLTVLAIIRWDIFVATHILHPTGQMEIKGDVRPGWALTTAMMMIVVMMTWFIGLISD